MSDIENIWKDSVIKSQLVQHIKKALYCEKHNK